MATTSIEWTEKTWNPVLGCDKVSPGCAHCYAAVMAKRLRAMALADLAAGRDPGLKRHYIDVVNDRGQWTGKLVTIPEKLADPMRAKKPTSYFVNSMSDLFHESVDFAFVDEVLMVAAVTPWHTYQILTKRIERALEYFQTRTLGDALTTIRELHGAEAVAAKPDWRGEIVGRYQLDDYFAGTRLGENSAYSEEATTHWADNPRPNRYPQAWPLKNVLIGPSIEDQKTAEKRMPAARELGKLGWRVMLSVEPLLEAVQLGSLDGIAWVIVGGESGHNARPCHVDWVRSILDQCREAGVACFVKQLGSNPRGHCADGNRAGKYIFDKKGGEPAEWPEDLRVRQMPVAAR
ncbi:MAG: phage Gp37/Gp68 family protein [Planctomycetales bacterium]|nr:phage Gp37/Gp68 family protein [Planctomycetales bacterium]